MTKTLSERVSLIKEYSNSFENQIIKGDLIHCLQYLNASLSIIEELEAENQALKIKNFENAKEQYEDFKVVSKENQALEAKVKELQAENKSWQEMVHSTNQTNQALIKRLQENKEEYVEAKDIDVPTKSIWKTDIIKYNHFPFRTSKE